MVRVVLTYGPTRPRLRADLSSLTGRLVSVRVVRGPSCLVPVETLVIVIITIINSSMCYYQFNTHLLMGYICWQIARTRNHKDTVWHLSTVLGNVKKNPYIINQNHIFLKKLLWSHFWIDFYKCYTKTFGIVFILIGYLLIMLLWVIFICT
jgi:hypothetical protein